MLKVLHLASWYPNRTGEQHGDFIQRQLQAISAQMPVHVIQVVKDEQANEAVEFINSSRDDLHETTVYYKSFRTGIRVLDRAISFKKFLRIFRNQVESYMAAHGKPDLIHVHVCMRAGVIALWAKRKYDIPFIVSEHWSGYYEADPDNIFVRGKSFQYYTKQILQNASCVITVSKSLEQKLIELYNIKKTAAVYNLVNVELFRFRPATHDDFVFAHISNMHPIKNVAGIFRVLAKLKKIRKDWRCNMIGEIDTKYMTLAIELGIDKNMQWVGSIAHQNVPTELNQANALLMFSELETLSCVICESLCCGVPVVATKVGGIPEIVNHTNGLLCNPGDEDQLLENILTMMNHYDRFHRSKIALDAAETFNTSHIADQIIEVYHKTING